MAFTSLGYMLEAEETIWDFWRAYIDIDIDLVDLISIYRVHFSTIQAVLEEYPLD